MNFYFLCLIALITLISVKDILNMSNKVVIIIGLLVVLGMILYKTKIEKFSLSFRARKSIAESLLKHKEQRTDQKETKKMINQIELEIDQS